jgi:hypothetical protein
VCCVCVCVCEGWKGWKGSSLGKFEFRGIEAFWTVAVERLARSNGNQLWKVPRSAVVEVYERMIRL